MSKTHSTTARQPELSKGFADWIRNTLLPFLKKELIGETAEPNDDAKDFGEQAMKSQIDQESSDCKIKIESLDTLLQTATIINPINQNTTIEKGSGAILIVGQQKVKVYVVDCEIAHIKPLVRNKDLVFCSTSSNLGKAILGKTVGESFTVENMISPGIGKPAQPVKVNGTVEEIILPKIIEQTIRELPLPASVTA